MDRCALFVDASYVLADGAMAVHGTRRGESVSWDYEGLLELLSGLARERTGLPLLRCYWYEATVDGRRTAEQDALADLPGIKLRVAKIRPGRREGVETEIHRDLTTLARNSAISDALVISAEEDLAQVIADVQDLGMRVTLVHIAVDGNWTISRALRQESDDIMEIGGEQLRPYVELIAGAEPVHADEPDDADRAAGRPLANGHSTVSGVGSYQQLPAGSGNHAPPAIYTAPVVAEYQRPALQLPRPTERPARDERSRDERSRDERSRDERSRDDRSRDERPHQDRPVPSANGEAPAAARQDLYAAPGMSGPPPRGRQDRAERQERLEPQHRPEPAAPAPGPRPRAAEDASGYPPGQQGAPGVPEAVPGIPSVTGLTGVPGLPGSPGTEGAQTPGQLRRLPSRSSGPGPAIAPMPSGPHAAQGQGSARSAPYTGPQPVVTSAPLGPAYQPAAPGPSGASLGDAVQAAHEEGQEFGASVARDAPALWLEAVLARKPRMPSDLEARLLQGSALPIDYLLHDEVRHALRRGFWDALERTRR
ncbi:MAG TPA: NYN domain-containing protein [Streptosporangiaceae bacterium]|nr:NYN domain-containing protein [Streptosporangiaceae bacterium]